MSAWSELAEDMLSKLGAAGDIMVVVGSLGIISAEG